MGISSLHLGQEFYGERLQDGWKFIRAEQLCREAGITNYKVMRDMKKTGFLSNWI